MAAPCFPAKMPDTTSSEDRVLTAPVVADRQPVPGRAAEHNLQTPPHQRGGPPPRSLRSSCRAAHTGRKPGAAVRRLLPGQRPLPRLACSLSGGLPGGRSSVRTGPTFWGNARCGQSISIQDTPSFVTNCTQESQCARSRSGTPPAWGPTGLPLRGKETGPSSVLMQSSCLESQPPDSLPPQNPPALPGPPQEHAGGPGSCQHTLGAPALGSNANTTILLRTQKPMTVKASSATEKVGAPPQHTALMLTSGVPVQSSRAPVSRTLGSICAPAARSRPGLDAPSVSQHSPAKTMPVLLQSPRSSAAQNPPSPELSIKTSTTDGGGGGGPVTLGTDTDALPSHSSSHPETS